MKKSIKNTLLIALVTITNMAMAQEFAVTERGDSVVLYANGLWDYKSNLNVIEEEDDEIKSNSTEFKKPKSSNLSAVGVTKSYKVWYNDKDWKRVPPAELSPDADLAFQMKNGGVYAMVIFEELEIPTANLCKLAIDNAVSVSPDMKIVDRDYRMVNGQKVIWMQMDGTIEGMKITYYSYYFSNEKGSIQFHTFTGQSLLKKYKSQMDEMLNGLTILD